MTDAVLHPSYEAISREAAKLAAEVMQLRDGLRDAIAGRDAAREELDGLRRSLESLAAEWDDDAHVAAQQGASPFTEVAYAVRTCAADLRQRAALKDASANGEEPR